MSNIKSITGPASTTAGAEVPLNTTPLLGGFGREGILNAPSSAIGAAVILLEGSPRTADNVRVWTTVATINNTTVFPLEVPDLPAYIRVRSTTAPAAIITFNLEGVQ